MATILTDSANYENIADSIRAVNGETTEYYPNQMAAAISELSPKESVRYTEQTLTLDQQTQARTNIGAVSQVAFDETQILIQEAIDNKVGAEHEHKVADITDLQTSFDELLLSAQNYTDGALANKADREHDHNDRYYTITQIDEKLEAKADTSDIPTALSDLSSDATHRTVTDAEKDIWNSKSNFSGNYNDLTDKPTDLTNKTYVDAQVSDAKDYANTAAQNVKNDLLNGAGAAYDTLKELGDLIDTNVNAIDALEKVAANKADKEHNHDDKYYTEAEIDTKLNGKAPTPHASADTTYGKGTSSNYGHVKLSDSTNSTSGASSGIAATPAAVKAVYDYTDSLTAADVGAIAEYKCTKELSTAGWYRIGWFNSRTAANQALVMLGSTYSDNPPSGVTALVTTSYYANTNVAPKIIVLNTSRASVFKEMRVIPTGSTSMAIEVYYDGGFDKNGNENSNIVTLSVIPTKATGEFTFGELAITTSTDAALLTQSLTEIPSGSALTSGNLSTLYGTHNKPTAADVGAAPAGFGLGENSRVSSDINTELDNGYFRITSATANYPFTHGAAHVTAYNDSEAVQRIISTVNGRELIRRTTDGGATWVVEEVNPPLNDGIEYCTIERFDGKTIYKRNNNGIIEYRIDGETEWNPYADLMGARSHTWMPTAVDLQAYALNGGTEITSGADLNSYTTPNSYRCPTQAIAASLLNTPYTSGGFSLIVERTSGVTGLYVIQTIKTGNSLATVYKRAYVNGTWGEWGKEYSELDKPTAMDIGVSRPNLADNWYFINPVNTKGQSSYASSGTTIDRWVSSHSSLKVTLTEYGMQLNNTSTGSTNYYLTQSPDNYQKLIGRTVTLSALVYDSATNSHTLYSKTGTIPAGNGTGNTYNVASNIGGSNQISVRVGSTGVVAVAVRVVPNSNVTLAAVKLELGGSQTLAYQDANGNWKLYDHIPNNSEEELKCAQANGHTVYHTGNKPTASTTYTATVTNTWTADSSYYYQDIAVNGILASDNPIVDILCGDDNALNSTYSDCMCNVLRIATSENNIRVWATSAMTTEFPIQLKVVR